MPYAANIAAKNMSFAALVPDFAELGTGSRFCIWGNSGCANLRADTHFEPGTQKCSYCRRRGLIPATENDSSKNMTRATEGTDLIFCVGKAHGPNLADHELPSSHFRPREPYPGEGHRGVQAWKIKRDVFCDHCRGIRDKDTDKLTGDPISQATYLPTDYFQLALSKKLDWWFSAFRRAVVAKKIVDIPSQRLIKQESDREWNTFCEAHNLEDIPNLPVWGDINLNDPCPMHLTKEDLAVYGFDALVEFNNSITDEEMAVFSMNLQADMFNSEGLPQFLGEAPPADQTTFLQNNHSDLLSTPFTQTPTPSAWNNTNDSTGTPYSSPILPPQTPLPAAFSPPLTHLTSPTQPQPHFQPTTPGTPSPPSTTSASSTTTASLTRRQASPELQQVLSALATCQSKATCLKCNRSGPVTLLFRGYMLMLPDKEVAATPEWRMCLRCVEAGETKGH